MAKKKTPPVLVNGAPIVASRPPKRWCKRGHELRGENVYVRPNGKRECRICTEERRSLRSLSVTDAGPTNRKSRRRTSVLTAPPMVTDPSNLRPGHVIRNGRMVYAVTTAETDLATGNTTLRALPGADEETKFLAQIKEIDGHWLWLGSVTGSGSPQTYWKGNVRTSRWVSWDIFVGAPPPKRYRIYASCGYQLCVNPDCIIAIRRGSREDGKPWAPLTPRQHRARFHPRCAAGHDLTNPDNIFSRYDGTRRCRICRNARAAARGAKAKPQERNPTAWRERAESWWDAVKGSADAS